MTAGHTGDKAKLFATGDCAWQQEVYSQQRTYIPIETAGTTLRPRTQRCSTLFSAGRSFPHDLEANVLGFYTARSVYMVQRPVLQSSGTFYSWQTHVGQYAINTTLTEHFLGTWTAAASASLSADDVTSPESAIAGGAVYLQEGERYDSRLWSGQIVASGTLIDTHAGPLQLALGGGYRQQNSLFVELPGGGLSVAKGRRIRFVSAESAIPLVRSPCAGARFLMEV